MRDLLFYAAQVVVLAIPGSPTADSTDEQGLAALAVLRAMGLPTLVGLVQESVSSLKAKSAAKKRGRALLDREVHARQGQAHRRAAVYEGNGLVQHATRCLGRASSLRHRES